MASSAISASLGAAAPSMACAAVADAKSFTGLKANTGLFAGKSAAQPLAISNGSKVSCMLVSPTLGRGSFSPKCHNLVELSHGTTWTLTCTTTLSFVMCHVLCVCVCVYTLHIHI